MNLLSRCLILCAGLTLAACGSSYQQGEGWTEVAGVDRDFIHVIVVEPGKEQKRTIYDQAVEALCDPDCYQVGFFMSGDPSPSGLSRQEFFDNGGWARYAPLAVYSDRSDGGVYTGWDCVRAGEDGAPLDALCGENAAEEYRAVLNLATRDGWHTSCGLPASDGRAVVERFAQAQGNEERAGQLMAAFDTMYEGARDGPDDPEACNYLRSKVEDDARTARAILTR